MTVGALAGCIGSAVLVWLMPTPSLPLAVSVPLPAAPQAKGVPTEEIHPGKVRVYQRPPVPLPGSKPTERVTATGRLQAEERPYTLSATLDTATGQSRIWAQPEPQPWLAINTHGETSLVYGYKAGGQALRLSHSQSLLQVKSLRLGLSTSLDSDGEWFAGAGISYRW